MKKIAIMIQKLNFGGAERCASNLSLDLSEMFDVHVIVFDGSNQMYPHGGKLHDLQIAKSSNLFVKIWNTIKRTVAVKKIKSEEKIDCSISLLTGANYVNVQSQVGDKTIISIRNNLSQSRLNRREVKMVKMSCKKADCVVALSKSVAKDMISNFGVPERKIVTIYNSCDSDRLLRLANETASELKIDGEYIVTMGRLMHQKGQWHLIRSFLKVHSVYPRLKLVILGEGEDNFQKRILDLVNKLKLNDNIIFSGYVKNPHKIIANSEFFVFPSLYEGLGNALLEALACRKAVISTDCKYGPREILAPNTNLDITEDSKLKTAEYAEYGVLVPAFTQEDDIDRTELSDTEMVLADTIIKLYSDKKLIKHYEDKTTERIMQFSPESIADEWKELIDSLLGDNNG